MNCPNCGKAVAPTEAFCGECGAPLTVPTALPDFAAAEQRFAALRAQYEAGTLDKMAFKTAVQELVVRDEKGEYWTIEAASGQWLWYDGASWVARQRPSAVTATSPAPSPTPTAAPPAQESTPKKGLPWVPIGIGCALLICLGAAIVGAVIAVPMVKKRASGRGTPVVTAVVIEPTLAGATAMPTEMPTEEAPQPTTILPQPTDTPTRGALELPTIELPATPTPLALPTVEPTDTPEPLPTPEPTEPATDFIVQEASLLPKSLNPCQTPFFELYVVDKDGKGLTNVQIAYTREGGSSDSEIKPSGWHDANKGFVRWDTMHNVYQFQVVFDASNPSQRFTSEETPPLDTRQVTDTQLLQQLGYCLPGTDCECHSFSYKVVFQRTW